MPTERKNDALTGGELGGEVEGAAPREYTAEQKQRKTKNAFSELMSPKKPKTSNEAPKTPKRLDSHGQRSLNVSFGRDALAAYTRSPTSFPASRVISFDDNFVVINDLYPKSQIHLLLLPRDPEKQKLHPFDALNGEDEAFCALVKAEVAKLRKLSASELCRRFGKYSASETARNAALDADNPCEEVDLPAGKDWEASIVSGVHAHPSMTHLHIHIISTDRESECMKHRKHYNSFATPFLVPVEDFPLAPDDPRRRPGREGYLNRALQCWRCGESFGNKFQRLKDHLTEEFELWKKE